MGVYHFSLSIADLANVCHVCPVQAEGHQAEVNRCITGNSGLTLCPLTTPGGLRDTHRDTQ